jgi:TRAP transporter TAXI family solute receptor
MKKTTILSVFIVIFAVILMPSLQLDLAFGQQKPGPLKITMAGYSVGGASAVVGEAVGQALKRSIPGSAFTYEPGRSGANEVTVATGKTELGLSHVWTTKAAMTAGEFYKQKYPNLRVITYLHETAVCMLFRKDAGINSLDEIKSKKFGLIAGVNTKHSLMETSARYTLEAYGVSFDDVESWGGKIHYLSSRPTFDLIRNKKANAFASCITPPYGAINELATTVDLVMLPMSAEAISYVAKKMGGGGIYIHQKKDYPKVLTEDVPAVGLPNIIITRAEVPEDQIYWITRSIYENLSSIKRAARQLGPMDKTTMATRIGSLPLHPGAKKFYREIGAPH